MSDLRTSTFGAADEPRPGDRIGDHEVLSELARGGMATVLAVRDLRTGDRRALKLLLPLGRQNRETQTRFRREFRALLRLDHPNVLRVYEWGMLGERPWFTMELLAGHDLRVEAERLSQRPPAERFERVRQIVIQIARALAYVHERGLVHRDVTPGNAMVAEDGTVKLMDFGVVKETDADLTAVGELIGTAAYMAPEQISGEIVDARADLYSLGAVTYLLLTGKRPFQAHTLHGFLEKHLNATPRPPRELVADVPEELEEICLRLLQKDPADRFASASHLLYVLGDRDHGEDLPGGWPTRTVGRTQIRARMREVVDDVASGRAGVALLLCGPPGLGKSRMLDLAESYARARGVPVGVGRCRAQDRPYGAFASVYRSLRGTQPPALLEQVFRGTEDARPTDRYPVLAAFHELVVDHAPLAIVLDDVQDADPATVELLVYLVRQTIELSDEPIAFVLSHEGPPDGAVQLRAQLEHLDVVETLELAPFAPAEVEELAVGILGADPAALGLAERLTREGEGSPAFIVDMLRSLIADGLIVEADGTWRLTVDEAQITQSQLPMPPSLRSALLERLAPLSEDALAVGRILALARHRIELDVLVDTARMAEDRVMEALDALVDAGIVAEHRLADRELVELSHGRFREVLVEKRGQDLRLDHRRLGEALERHHRGQLGAVVDELAYQFEHAELWPKAYRYLVSSANRHLQRSLYQESLAMLERALGMEAMARPYLLLDSADRRLAEVWLCIARARHGLGQLPEAVLATTEAQRLARLVRDAGLESRVAAELGVQLRQQGRVDEAEVQLKSAVARAEEAGDQTLLPVALYELGGARWSRGDLEGAEQYWKRSLQIAQQVGDERAQGHGYNGLAVLAICRGQPMEARRHLEQSATVFERLGMLGPLVVARCNLVEVFADSGSLRKGLALADRTLSQSEEAAFPQGIALGKGWRARVLVRLGRVDEAVREAQQALEVVRRLEIREDEAMVRCALVEAVLARRDHEEALAEIAALEEVLGIHDPEGIADEVRGWRATALVGVGRVAEAGRVLDQDASRPRAWPHVQVRTDLAVGRALADVGRAVAAKELLQRALAQSEANGFRYFQLVAHLHLLRVSDDASVRDRHQRVASGLARSLAANLPADDAARFLGHYELR
ncbi:MAG: protein kinase [Myxococcota bacterium]